MPLLPLDGEPSSVGSLLSKHAAVAFVFFGASCPCVRRYQARIEALEEAWRGRGLGVYLVDSNADDGVELLRTTLAERRVRTPLWRDPGGELADALGATSTPAVVLVDARGEVAFRGWLDNEREVGAEGRVPYLEDAVKGLFEGRSFARRSPTYGCAITRSLTASSDATPCGCGTKTGEVAGACGAPSGEASAAGSPAPGTPAPRGDPP